MERFAKGKLPIGPGDLILISSPTALFHYRPDAVMLVITDMEVTDWQQDYILIAISVRRVLCDPYRREGTWSLNGEIPVYNKRQQRCGIGQSTQRSSAQPAELSDPPIMTKSYLSGNYTKMYEGKVGAMHMEKENGDLVDPKKIPEEDNKYTAMNIQLEPFEEANLSRFIHAPVVSIDFDPTARSIRKAFGPSQSDCSVPGCVVGLVCTKCTGLDKVYPGLETNAEEHQLMHKVGTLCPACVGHCQTRQDLNAIRVCPILKKNNLNRLMSVQQWCNRTKNDVYDGTRYEIRESDVSKMVKEASGFTYPKSDPVLWGLPAVPGVPHTIEYWNFATGNSYDDGIDDRPIKKRLHQWKLQSLIEDSRSATLLTIERLNRASNVRCPICYDNFRTGDILTTSTCPGRHVFHTKCVVPLWWVENNTCPLDFIRLDKKEVRDARKD